MRSYDTGHIRSFALVGHHGCGKTSLGEAVAYLTGHVDRLGHAASATSLLDFEPEEQKHGHSMSAKFLTAEFENYKLHVVDTPGDGNFLHEARSVLQGVDAAVVVVSAVDGVQVATEQVNAFARTMRLPRAVFVNRMDQKNADYRSVIEDLSAALDLKPVLLQLPLGTGDDFRGVIDLVNRRALVYERGGNGLPTEAPIPSERQTEVNRAIDLLMDAVASTDDALVEKYLEEGALSGEEIRSGVNAGIMAGTLAPVILGSATYNIAVDRLLWLARAFPSAKRRAPALATRTADEATVERPGVEAAPFSALCIKTLIDPYAGQVSVFRCASGSLRSDAVVRNPRTDDDERLHGLFHLAGKDHIQVDRVVAGDLFGVAKLKDVVTGDTLCDPREVVILPYVTPPPPMISCTVVPKSRKDTDKLRSALSRILAEDVGLQQAFDDVTKEIVLSGMGSAHVQAATEKMARKYGVEVELGTPAIPYRETIAGKADVRYRHKKQTGGAGQFGEVAIRVSPNGRGRGFEFVNNVYGGSIPTALVPAVEKGVIDRLASGVLAGFPVVDVRVELYDGKYHPVDSKDIAFQIAGRHAVKEAVLSARPILLEPIQAVDVVLPAEQVGDVMGDLNARRGRIVTMDNRGRNAVVKALVPLAEMLDYAQTLKAMTAGKGSFTMVLHGYEPVPPHMQDKIVNQIKRISDEEP